MCQKKEKKLENVIKLGNVFYVLYIYKEREKYTNPGVSCPRPHLGSRNKFISGAQNASPATT